MHWIVDGNNVLGAGADGWWNDPVKAAARLTQSIAEWSRTHEDRVTVVFDGAPEDRLAELAGGNLEVLFATRRGRDAADDRIVELVLELMEDPEISPEAVTVVTSDRGLRARVPVGSEGAGRFRARIGLAPSGRLR